jgi:phosphoesterase RecJ-like protein
MTDYRSNIDLRTVATKMIDVRKVSVTTHAKPDGDAFGSVVAVMAVMMQMGKSVDAFLIPPVPQCFDTLRGRELVRVIDMDSPPTPDMSVDCLIVLDTGAKAQLVPMADGLTPLWPRTLIIDHHLTGDVPAAWRYIDGRAAACCQIVAELIDELERLRGTPGKLLSPTVCEALYVGLSSDTGWFRFSNTQPRTHELAAKLMLLGVDPASLYSKLEQAERPEKLALMTRALDSLKMLSGGRLAVMVLRSSDFVETGAMLEETERFVDIPQMVSTVRVVALLVEPPVGGTSGSASDSPAIRIGFRSKPGPRAVNVARLAQQFGGGGHAQAAGAKVTGALDQVVSRVCQAAEQIIAAS